MTTPIRILMLAVLAAELAACQGPQAFQTPDASSATFNSVRLANDSGTLYVANRYNNRITEYAPGSQIVKLSITTGINTPDALAEDSLGNLYVANAGSWPSVSVYAPRSNMPLRSITQCIAIAVALAFDSQENLYVADDAGCQDHDFDVLVYPPGSGTLSRIYVQGIDYPPVALAFDASGSLYVAEAAYGANGKVAVFPPQSTAPSRFISEGINDPEGMAFDSSGKLYVSNSVGNTVTVYAPGSGSVKQTISEGLSSPLGLVFDSSGNLYVANFGGKSVTVYAPGSKSVLRTITEGISSPRVLAFDPNGNLYVLCAKGPNHVSEYAPGSSKPFLVIKQTHGIHWPTAMLFGT